MVPEIPADDSSSDDLASELKQFWALLARGVADKRSHFNTPTLATIAGDGAPAQRTVVLRACRPSHRELEFHTDARSAKMAEIANGAAVGWHVWDPRTSLQFRISSQARAHRGDTVAEAAWDRLHPGSRAIYAQSASPGAPITDRQAAATDRVSDAEAYRHFVC
ncbi:MAG: pyridoxamine 5'-phosphate oxidase family protein, partial [Pseudomonadota bacterium]